MASIIVKSGYIKSPEHVANLIDYAGNKLEAQLLYLEDGSIQTIDEGIYLKYMATRPSVEIAAGRHHGLFTLEGEADMQRELDRLKEHKDSIKWSQIISLGREDAERTGFDNRRAWQNLVRAKADQIAKIYNIDLKHLVVNAAYHDKDYHPHIHLVFYSTEKREGFVPDMAKASEKLKSLMFNEIFKEDVAQLKELKTEQRSELDQLLEKNLKRLYSKEYSPPSQLSSMLDDLSDSLKGIPGKKVYGYLPPELKEKVSGILKYVIDQDRQLSDTYRAYLGTQRGFVSQYVDTPEKVDARMQQFEDGFFHPGKYDAKTLHNIIVKYAAALEDGPPVEIPSTVQKERDDPEEAPEYSIRDDPPGAFSDELPEEMPITVQKEKGHSKSSLWTDEYKQARAFLYGQEDDQNYEKAFEFLQAEASNGNSLAQYTLGREYLKGDKVQKDIGQALDYMKASADNGNEFAQYTLGKLFLKGEDVKQDIPAALNYLEQSAAQGNQFAQYRLGRIYVMGDIIKRDLFKGVSLLELSADQGNAAAQYMLGKMRLTGNEIDQDIPRAVQLLRGAADQDYDAAQYSLGRLYLDGRTVPKDVLQAEYWLKRSVKHDNANAMYTLGREYLKGENLMKNVDAAASLLRRAAVKENSNAQYALGRLYLDGTETGKALGEAFIWLNKAAAHNNQYAQYILGREYYRGESVPKNLEYAKQYLSTSAGQGNEYARQLLDYINNGRKQSAAYAAVLLMRDLAYAIGKDARENDRHYGKDKAFHVSQTKRRFIKRKRQQQRNIAEDISY